MRVLAIPPAAPDICGLCGSVPYRECGDAAARRAEGRTAGQDLGTSLMSDCIVAAQIVMVPMALLVGAKADM